MPTEILERINAGVERVQRDIFENGGMRVWRNDGVDVLLSSPDNDVMIVFTHFLQHFFVVLFRTISSQRSGDNCSRFGGNHCSDLDGSGQIRP